MSDDRDLWTAYAERQGILRGVPAAPKASKYHAVPVHVDGVRFASKKEAARFLELQCWQKAGQIADLARQPVFPLVVNRRDVGRYTADFQYTRLDTGEIVVEDVKSSATRTEAYRLRKKIAEAIHGITIDEV